MFERSKLKIVQPADCLLDSYRKREHLCGRGLQQDIGKPIQ